jgi:hypothetical protein
MGTPFIEASDRVMALLRNARRIATTRQDRRLAMDVLKACSLYVKGTSFPCDPEVFEKLSKSIIDKQTPAIIEEFAKVEKMLSDSFAVSDTRAWRTIKLPKNR